MNAELDRIWKETAVASSRYYPGICMEGLRNTTNHISQDNRCHDLASNGTLPEYISKALPLD
jgi:hypothetical protein